MKLSIVTTLYCSAPYINEFYDRARAVAERVAGDEFEIVFVNDGSSDDGLSLAIKLTEQDHHVVVVDLSRNYGHHKAMMTALAHAKGERVFLIDSDLEEEPEWLLSFENQMQQEGCDVVYGVQERRRGRGFEYWSGLWFYRLFNGLTGLNLPENIVTARLMTRRYVDALLSHQERETFIIGLLSITGFDQRVQFVTKHRNSETTYNFQKKMGILINAVTSFSSAPLFYIFYIGIFIFLFSLISIVYLFVHWFLYETPVSGWASVMASIWLLGGMIISFIGVVGIYLSKIFSETKQRPYTIVRQIYAQPKD